MSVRWCWLGSHEIPDGEPMVTPPREPSHICIPCSQTERGQRLMHPGERTDGYHASQHARDGKWQRIYAAMGQADYLRKRHGG